MNSLRVKALLVLIKGRADELRAKSIIKLVEELEEELKEELSLEQKLYSLVSEPKRIGIGQPYKEVKRKRVLEE